MSLTLVRGRHVVTRIVGNEAVAVEDGAVLVDGGTIRDVGIFEAMRAQHSDVPVIGSGREVVAPGFVNAHHHVGLTPTQLGVPDLPLELWLAAKIGMRPVDPYLDTLYSAFEMIASGVTTVQHLHVARAAPPEIERATADILRAYADIGMRVSYSHGYRDQNRLVYGDDDTFLAGLPPPLAGELGGWFAMQNVPMRDQLDLYEALRSRHDGTAGGRIRIQLAPSNLHWCSDEALGAIGDLSARDGVPMHLHLLETPYQQEYASRHYRHSAVRHLHALGLLGPRLTLGHAVWVDEEDIALIAESGTHICHNPSSNLRLRSGIAPCNCFLEQGIPVALGIDEAGLNDDRDMLQEMRLALRLHRTPGMDPRAVPSAAQIFRMATEWGADTTPFARSIGVLEPGRAADLVLYCWETIARPFLDPATPLLDALVLRARQNAVQAVMIDGRVVYSDGSFTFVDQDLALGELQAAMAAAPTERDLRRRRLAGDLAPFVARFYEGWGPTRR